MAELPPPSSTFLRTAPNVQREYARWLGKTELHAILPLKWGMLLICGFYWMWVRDWEPPSTAVFSALFIYGALAAAEHLLFLLDRVGTSQVRPVVYLSYIVDMAFITAIIWLDVREPPPSIVQVAPGSDYYILYLLLILRGFSLFRTPLENMAMAALISVLFLVTLMWQGQEWSALASKAVVLRLGLIWAIMLLATFIVDVVNKQKEEVLRVRERLVRSESLASLGELAAGVAHEINNPIGIIKTYAEYLKKAGPEGDPHHEDFETIQREAERCEHIVRRMMDFANPNIRAMEPFSLPEIVEDVVQFVFHGKGDSKVQVEIEVNGTIPPAYGDTGQVRQAVLNILMNARQILTESGKPGRITIRIRQLSGPRAPIEVAIHDDGPGIDPEDAERAFEPFFTRRRGGTGLGLAITRRIIEAHEGTIAIWPSGSGGTTCAFTVPMAAEDK
ncbi:hypothetical protein HZA57_05860 [Candidatus Poribacteria bacterium]|nr:hypothetical protein [Candidatus Poribacteria bacterium]